MTEEDINSVSSSDDTCFSATEKISRGRNGHNLKSSESDYADCSDVKNVINKYNVQDYADITPLSFDQSKSATVDDVSSPTFFISGKNCRKIDDGVTNSMAIKDKQTPVINKICLTSTEHGAQFPVRRQSSESISSILSDALDLHTENQPKTKPVSRKRKDIKHSESFLKHKAKTLAKQQKETVQNSSDRLSDSSLEYELASSHMAIKGKDDDSISNVEPRLDPADPPNLSQDSNDTSPMNDASSIKYDEDNVKEAEKKTDEDTEIKDPWVRPVLNTQSQTTRIQFITPAENPTPGEDRNNIHLPAGVATPNSRERSHSQEELAEIENAGIRRRRSNEEATRERARNDLDLLSRPSWCDASFALSRIKEGKATGNPYALKLRSLLHRALFWAGYKIQKNAWTVLFIGVMLMSACCIGFKQAHMEVRIEKLWVETGGQLAEEIEYMQRNLEIDSDAASAGYTIEIMIQTGQKLNDIDSLKLHLEAAIAATKVTVEMYNQTWSFNDVCYKQSIPVNSEDSSFFSYILESVFPCFIITPLDCFWDGSKLLGPDPPLPFSVSSQSITWKSLNPLILIDDVIASVSPDAKSYRNELFYYRNLMVEAGITSGYTEKWCLDPYDPECPPTAPNFNSKELPDVNALFETGCTGFASNLMRWPLDLIVGGIQRDPTGNISTAQGLQTLFQLMGEQNMYEYHQTIKTDPGWSRERAAEILAQWQRKYVETIYSVETANTSANSSDDLFAFSTTTLTDILTEFSDISYIRVIGGYILMIGYACISLMRTRASRSQGAVGVLGVLLVALSVAAGLGISSVVGISFNAASTQVLPFLMLGLGVDDMFLMAHHFGEIAVLTYIPFQERTGECLKRVGVSVILTSTAILSGFLFSLIIPMPALRAFGKQAAIVTVFNLIGVLVIFPALLSIDLKRRKSNKLDILCCFDSSAVNDVIDITSESQNNRHCSHHHHVVHHPTALPGNQIERNTEATITMHHTVQAYSNKSFTTVLGPSAKPNPGSSPSSGYQTPRTPPPEYSSRDGTVTPSRPRVAFVNQSGISDGSPSSRGNIVHTNPVPPSSGRKSHRSNPSTNLSTPMESVRSSTNSLVPHRRKKKGFTWLPNRGKRSGARYAWCAKLPSMTISQLGERYYAPFLLRKPVKISVLIFFTLLLGASIYGSTQVTDGLDIGDILPRDTREHQALVAQTTYFSFFNMYIITRQFDYATNQQNLLNLHYQVGNYSYVIRQLDGTVQKFWLQYFSDWLNLLQEEFDRDWALGNVNEVTWTPQASDNTVLAFKLLLQTGRRERPVDPGRIGCTAFTANCTKVNLVRLVSPEGIIREDGFYNYLSAWVSGDPLSYAASQAQIKPDPTPWEHVRGEMNLEITRSPSIVYAQMPYYLNNLREDQDVITVIREMRNICETTAAVTDVDSYPSGYPFTFWQQYIDLRYWLFIALGCVIAAIFVVLSLVLLNVWASAIMAVFLAMITTELFGFMGASGVKLSAVPAVILVAAIGIGVEFTVHITFAFITSCGSKNERVQSSIGHMLGPVLDGAISTLLGVVMLSGSEFDFIVKYFFFVLFVLLVLGVLNGLILLPVVLSLIGPPSEVLPVGGGSRLKTPTPPGTPPNEIECDCHFVPDQRMNRNSNNSNNRGFVHHHQRCAHARNFSTSRDNVSNHRQWSSDANCRRNLNIHRRNRATMRSFYNQSHSTPPIYEEPHHYQDGEYPNYHINRTSRPAWNGSHPFSVPLSRQEETRERVREEGEEEGVYMQPGFVVYSSNRNNPQQSPMANRDNHCENEFSYSRSAPRMPQGGARGSRYDDGVTHEPIATVTSSVTLKLHSSGRQKMVAFVDQQPSTSSMTSSSRRFDISALNDHDVSDRDVTFDKAPL